MNPASMTYRDTLAYLAGLDRMGIRFGLEPIRALLDRLHNPQDCYPAVLIAGTNGKGSVAAMTASILSAGGFRTGMYTSPDLIDFRERIRIDGEMIGRGEAAICAEQVKEKMSGGGELFRIPDGDGFPPFPKAAGGYRRSGDRDGGTARCHQCCSSPPLGHHQCFPRTPRVSRQYAGEDRPGKGRDYQGGRAMSDRGEAEAGRRALWRPSAANAGRRSPAWGRMSESGFTGTGRFPTAASGAAIGDLPARSQGGTSTSTPLWRWAQRN